MESEKIGTILGNINSNNNDSMLYERPKVRQTNVIYDIDQCKVAPPKISKNKRNIIKRKIVEFYEEFKFRDTKEILNNPNKLENLIRSIASFGEIDLKKLSNMNYVLDIQSGMLEYPETENGVQPYNQEFVLKRPKKIIHVEMTSSSEEDDDEEVGNQTQNSQKGDILPPKQRFISERSMVQEESVIEDEEEVLLSEEDDDLGLFLDHEIEQAELNEEKKKKMIKKMKVKPPSNRWKMSEDDKQKKRDRQKAMKIFELKDNLRQRMDSQKTKKKTKSVFFNDSVSSDDGRVGGADLNDSDDELYN